MDETRAQAYLQLIQTLLNCPNGDESQILQANLELLDGGQNHWLIIFSF